MFDFFKKISTTANPSTPTNQESSDGSYQGLSKFLFLFFTRKVVHMIECENLPDFLQINFPILSQRSELYSEKQKAFKTREKQIDISVYFKEEDKYLAETLDKSSIVLKEYEVLPSELKLEQIKNRLDELEGYDQVLTDIMKKSFAKNYDKFRNKELCIEFK